MRCLQRMLARDPEDRPSADEICQWVPPPPRSSSDSEHTARHSSMQASWNSIQQTAQASGVLGLSNRQNAADKGDGHGFVLEGIFKGRAGSCGGGKEQKRKLLDCKGVKRCTGAKHATLTMTRIMQ
jgi:hypothetical protein